MFSFYFTTGFLQAVHVSAVLQALASIKPVPFNLTNLAVHDASDPDATDVHYLACGRHQKSESRVQCICRKQCLRNTTIASQ